MEQEQNTYGGRVPAVAESAVAVPGTQHGTRTLVSVPKAKRGAPRDHSDRLQRAAQSTQHSLWL